MTSGFCLMLPMRTSRQPWPMSWAVATGTPGTSRPGPCGTGRPPPLGEPRQRHWHLAMRNRHDSDDPRPQAVIPDGDRPGLPGEPDMGRGIRACRAGPVTNSSGIRGSSSCRTSVAHRAVGPWQAVLLLAVLLRRPNREASNQLSDYDHGQWRTPGNADGGWCRAGQQGRKSLPAPTGSPRLIATTPAGTDRRHDLSRLTPKVGRRRRTRARFELAAIEDTGGVGGRLGALLHARA